jgi:hypothetical protein
MHSQEECSEPRSVEGDTEAAFQKAALLLGTRCSGWLSCVYHPFMGSAQLCRFSSLFLWWWRGVSVFPAFCILVEAETPAIFKD